MARSLGMSTVAEGVETAEQYKSLIQLGCLDGQGYYMARPQSESGIKSLIEKGLPLIAGDD